MSEFKAGDLCQIVDHPEWLPLTLPGRKLIGYHVVLSKPLTANQCNCKWCPHWVIATQLPGEPSARPSEKILRKIPPPALDEQTTNEEELLV